MATAAAATGAPLVPVSAQGVLLPLVKLEPDEDGEGRQPRDQGVEEEVLGLRGVHLAFMATPTLGATHTTRKEDFFFAVLCAQIRKEKGEKKSREIYSSHFRILDCFVLQSNSVNRKLGSIRSF